MGCSVSAPVVVPVELPESSSLSNAEESAAPARGADLSAPTGISSTGAGAVAVTFAAAAPSHPDGITLAGLRAFVAEHGGTDILAHKTTNDIKWEHVIPTTKTVACSYASMLRARAAATGSRSDEVVGRANAFVSHVYTYNFLSVIEAIAAWEARLPAGEPRVFYYFDLLVVNQHGQSAAVAPSVLWREFTGGVRAIGRTLLVLTLDAAERGPLTRAWCVAEIAAGLQGEGAGGTAVPSFEVVMSPVEEARFLEELTCDFEHIVQRTCTVDLARCHAWHGDECLDNGVCRDVAAGRVAVCSNDLGFVIENVRRELPFEEANKRVIQLMNRSMVGMGRKALARLPTKNERSGSLLQAYLARLLADCGRLKEAEALLSETAEVVRSTLGSEAERTLSAIGQLAEVLRMQSKLDEAEPLYREVLAAQRRTLGDAHQSTLTTACNLGLLFYSRGDLGGAEQLLREALAGLRRSLGDAHPTTVATIGNLGELLRVRGNFDGAESLMREAVDARGRTLGNTHPNTLISIGNLAELLKDRGDLEGAEPLMRESVKVK